MTDQDASSQDNTGAGSVDTTSAETADKVYGKPADDAASKPAEPAKEDGQDGDKAKSEDADGKKPEGDKDKKEAPDAYEDFTVPDGMEIDAALLEQFTPVAQELGLTQEQAQAIVNLRIADVEQQQKAWSETNDKWAKACRDDAEFGGDKFDENLASVLKSLDTFGTPALREALDMTGLGNHPEFFRFALRASKGLGEDGLVRGETTAGQPLSQADRLFGTK